MTESLATSVFGVFESVADWFVGAMEGFVGMFYAADTGLTFLGIMALIGVGIAVARMLFAIVTSFIQLKSGG